MADHEVNSTSDKQPGEVSVDNLKMAKLRATTSGEENTSLDGQAVTEWTVIYSDTNSSIVDDCQPDSDDSTDNDPASAPSTDSPPSRSDSPLLEHDLLDQPNTASPQVIDTVDAQKGLVVVVESATEEAIEAFNLNDPLNDKMESISSAEPSDDEVFVNESGEVDQHLVFELDKGSWSLDTARLLPPPLHFASTGKLRKRRNVKLSEESHPPPPPPSFADNFDEANLTDSDNSIDIIQPEEANDIEEVDDEMEEDDEEDVSTMSSVISRASSFERFRLQLSQPHLGQLRALFGDSAATSEQPSDDEEPSGQYDLFVGKSRRIRAYFHQRNAVLNGKLNFFVILTLTAVVGLGIGHFLGWSNQRDQASKVSMSQVHKLRQLQEDLMMCMKSQSITGHNDDTHTTKVCLHDDAYWIERFRTLFNENHNLMELFQKTQKHFYENGHHDDILGEQDCVNKTTSDEFHNLKLDLLIKQMEHLNLLEVLEKVKHKGQESAKRVLVLEEENEDLKKKLEEEEEDDAVIVQTWGTRVARLEEENEELRKSFTIDELEDNLLIEDLRKKVDALTTENIQLKEILDQLNKQVLKQEQLESVEATAPPNYHAKWSQGVSHRYNTLRHRINQMMSENEDLKSKIAQYRYSPSYNNHEDHDDINGRDPKDRMLESLRTRLFVMHRQLTIEKNEAQHWREKFEILKQNEQYLKEKLGRYMRRHNVDSDKFKDEDYDEDDDDDDKDYEKTKRESKKHKSKQKHDKRSKGKQMMDQVKESLSDLFKSGEELWSNIVAQVKQSYGQNEKAKSEEDETTHNDDEEKSNKEEPKSNWKESFGLNRKVWNNMLEKMKKKYHKLGEQINKDFNREKLSNMGRNLVDNTMETMQKLSDSLVKHSVNSQVVGYLTDKMTNFAHMVENSWNKNFQELKKHFQTKQSATEDKKSNEKNQAKGDGVERTHNVAPGHQSDDEVGSWVIKRAKVREEMRKGDLPEERIIPTKPEYPSQKAEKRENWNIKRGKGRSKFRENRIKKHVK